MAAAFFALSGVAGAQGGTAAAAASGASAASAAAAAPVLAAPVIGQYPVHPGQSLHDIAVDLTHSHDKGVLARVSQALFDANPGAFAKHDPSRLKVGSVLNVPGVPDVVAGASGVTAASAPAAVASAPAANATPASAAAVAAVAGAQAGAQAAAHGASAATAVGASTNAVASASAVQAASASATGASAAAIADTASGASGAAAQAVVAAASGVSASAAVGQPASAAASPSDAHVWSGSIQAAPAAGTASGAALAQTASSAPVPVSSLQQLLALKNRVLMALQKHGIGKAAQPAGATSGAAANTAGTHGAAAGVAQPGVTGAQPELSPVALGGAAAVGAALLALIFRLLTRKRKKPDDAADETTVPGNVPPVADTQLHVAPPAEPRPLAAAPAEPEPPQPDERLDHATDAASLSAVTSLGGEALPPTFPREEAGHDGPPALHEDRVDQGVTPHGAEPGEPETLADASEAASFAAAAELGASALPPESIATPHTAGEAEELARAAEPEEPLVAYEPEAPQPEAPQPEAPQPEAPQPETPHVAPQHIAEEVPAAAAHETPAPETAEPPVMSEPAHSAPQTAQPQYPQPTHPAEPATPVVPAEDMKYAEVPIEFPADAVSAMGSIDMPLPPRVPEPIASGAPLSTEPVASPEATAAQAVPLAEPPVPPAGKAIEAGTAGPGSIAGLGAPRFGVLTLDFDLNLPPDSAEPLPVFTPEQLARIARNKLELAHEYIALGDLAGARSLINEVIESDDPAARGDAQALLSTLAPLS